MRTLAIAVAVTALQAASWLYPPASQVPREDLGVVIADVVKFPVGSPPVNRISVLRQEPGPAAVASTRLFITDLDGKVYILDTATNGITTYIDFAAVFPKFVDGSSLGMGLSTLAFDPDYEHNGRFYTVHSEAPLRSGSEMPTNASLPGLDLTDYSTTVSVDPPATTVARQSVVIEWTDTSVDDDAFQGTAREVLRVGFEGGNHPVADVIFNPTASPGHPDWGNLYLSVGDGGSGQVAGHRHATPQRLDLLPGKILRITPDITLRAADALGPNGRYRIPSTGADPNPFVSLTLPDLRPEIFAYGFRNPQRLSWDAVSNALFVADIGLFAWEEIDLVHKGANYGYADREGGEQLFIGGEHNGLTGSRVEPPVPHPAPDVLSVIGLPDPVVPAYPVATYSHRDGDAIAGGFVYRGAQLPHLIGKYVFGDVTTGRLFYADVADMIAADDGDPSTMAPIRELQVLFDSPRDTPDRGAFVTRLFDVVAGEFAAAGGVAPGGVLPGAADHVSDGVDPEGVPYGGGRADIRLAVDGGGELYVLSKNDGMLRKIVTTVTGATTTTVQVPAAPTPAGGSVAVQVQVTSRAGDPQGTVAVLDGETVLGSIEIVAGTAVFHAAGLAAGSHQIRARYEGTTTFMPSVSTPADHLVLQPSSVVLTVTVQGQGAVASEPAGVLCPSMCQAEFPAGTTVTLNPEAQATTIFTAWSGACTGAGPCVLTLEADETVTASFALRRADLATVVNAVGATVPPGAKLAVTDTATNVGTAATVSSKTRMSLSIDTVLDATDILLGTRNVGSLAAGAFSTATSSLTVPSSTPYGRYYLMACADSAGVIVEQDEQNNCGVSASQVTVSRADLRQLSVSTATEVVAPGGVMVLVDSVSNDGGHTTGLTTTTRYYLSPDAARSGDDVLLTGSRSVPSLLPGASSSGSRNATVPAAAPLGAQYVLACADDTSRVVELLETNNCAASVTTVHVGRPDLALVTVSAPPPVAARGSSFSVTTTTANLGTAPSKPSQTRFYLSRDAVRDATDVLLAASRSVSALAAGTSYTGPRAVTVPTTMPGGDFVLIACADDTATNAETDETNNCLAAPATLRVP